MPSWNGGGNIDGERGDGVDSGWYAERDDGDEYGIGAAAPALMDRVDSRGGGGGEDEREGGAAPGVETANGLKLPPDTPGDDCCKG